MAPHRLLVVMRRVPRERLGEYAHAWERVRSAAAAAGVHAWRFQATPPADPDEYLEFLEWSSTAGDPTVGGTLGAAAGQLQAAFPGEARRWDEVVEELAEEG